MLLPLNRICPTVRRFPKIQDSKKKSCVSVCLSLRHSFFVVKKLCLRHSQTLTKQFFPSIISRGRSASLISCLSTRQLLVSEFQEKLQQGYAFAAGEAGCFVLFRADSFFLFLDIMYLNDALRKFANT